jgi:hypothetical protein
MVPKLKAFYWTHVLPEIANPRYRSVSDIRKLYSHGCVTYSLIYFII